MARHRRHRCGESPAGPRLPGTMGSHLGCFRIAIQSAKDHTMKITAEDIKAGYRRMSDEELLSLNRGELTDLARQCYDEEVQARGLEEPENQSEDAVQDRPEAMPDEEMVVVAAPRYFDAAREMQATLESADIPAGKIGRAHV